MPIARRSRGPVTGGRLAPLDGVRAVAIVVVMGYHSGLPGLRTGGFYGQDAFFVLSGLLITSLLLREAGASGSVDLPAFWGKRMRRLLPALVVMLVVVAGYVRFVAASGRYPGFAGDARSALFYYANWHLIAASSDYFAQTGTASLLTHTWSLAIEEQYYLVWPLVVLAAAAALRRRRQLLPVAVLAVASAGAVGSAAWMAVLRVQGASPARLYYGTFTHAQCLLVGSAVAAGLALARRRGPATEAMFPVVRDPVTALAMTVAAVAAAAGLVVVWTHVSYASPFADEGGFLVVALCTATVLVALVCVPRGPVARALGVRPLALVGLISYGMYLWYFPVFAVVTRSSTGLRTWWLFAARAAVVLALATASYLLVERPLRHGLALRLDARTWSGRVRPVALVGAMVVATLAAVQATAPAGASAAASGGGPAALPAALPSAALPSTALPPTALPSAGAGGSTVTASRPQRILVVGDSTAVTLGYSLADSELEGEYGYRMIDDATLGCGLVVSADVLAHGAAAVTPGQCNPGSPPAQQWPALVRADVASSRPDVVLVAAGRWETHDRRPRAGDRYVDITEPGDAAYVRGQLELAVTVAHSGGARVALATAPCFSSGEQPDGDRWPEDDPARVAAYDALVTQVAAAHPGVVSVAPLHDLVCPGGRFVTTIDGTTVRAPDGVHYPFFTLAHPDAPDPDTLAQVQAFGRWLAPRLLPGVLAPAASP